MNTTQYISKDIGALNLKSTIAEAKQLFHKLTFSHLPVVDKNCLVGLIAESDMQSVEESDAFLHDFNYLFDHFYAEEKDYCLELLRLFAINETNILPLIDSNKMYLGYYELSDILHFYYDTPFLNEEGITLIIQKGSKDYSFSEITQIAEANEAKLLGLYISDMHNDLVQITLKINIMEMNETIQAFRRYGYEVITEHQDDYHIENLKERSEYLKKYLNI